LQRWLRVLNEGLVLLNQKVVKLERSKELNWEGEDSQELNLM
jgi:hypothetical protein